VTIVRGDLREVLQTIRETARKNIWLFGGGNLFRSLLEQGQVDYLEIALVPVLLGKGVPMLPATRQPQTL
jgi:dihydrofolate reductase